MEWIWAAEAEAVESSLDPQQSKKELILFKSVVVERALLLVLVTVNHLVTSLVLVPQQVKIVNSMALLPKAAELEVVLIIDTHQNHLEVMVVVVEVPQDIVMVDLEAVVLVQHYKVSKVVEVVPSIILAAAEVQHHKVLTPLVHQMVVMELAVLLLALLTTGAEEEADLAAPGRGCAELAVVGAEGSTRASDDDPLILT